MILRKWIDPAELPTEVAITAITLAELSASPHGVRRNEDQRDYDEHAERGRRLNILQRAENEFDPIPFDTEAARLYGRVRASVISAGRKPPPPRRRPHDRRGTPPLHRQPRRVQGPRRAPPVVPVTRPTILHDR